ncbi:MAG: hypothetical protein A2086_01080 [Spirochaetes bacterium GWD1_27_9]|nr:MAG: hypothetical protein A2Z98_16010 [Spirochaetes bacterium GWB1_27_13]OHD33645.1 MAG: hypothetical protein A2086_01080 [Spirochaetes bacterium GWD1_27_9]
MYLKNIKHLINDLQAEELNELLQIILNKMSNNPNYLEFLDEHKQILDERLDKINNSKVKWKNWDEIKVRVLNNEI